MPPPSPSSGFVTASGVRLHYLDWGGSGPALVFLAGMGCTAHFFNRFAPRFTDAFRVLALTRRGHGDSDQPDSGYDIDSLAEDIRQALDALHIDQAILVGHSMAHVEVSHFAALYPQRVLKVIFLDAAYDRTSPAFKAMIEKNPQRMIPPPDPRDAFDTVSDYITALKTNMPALAVLWDDWMDDVIAPSVTVTPEGKVVDKMRGEVEQALMETLYSYEPEDECIQCPVLSFYAHGDPSDYIAPYMTEDQQALVREFFTVIRPPVMAEIIEGFRKKVPHAKIVEIPRGHHYCFIKQADLVYREMRSFLGA